MIHPYIFSVKQEPSSVLANGSNSKYPSSVQPSTVAGAHGVTVPTSIQFYLIINMVSNIKDKLYVVIIVFQKFTDV